MLMWLLLLYLLHIFWFWFCFVIQLIHSLMYLLSTYCVKCLVRCSHCALAESHEGDGPKLDYWPWKYLEEAKLSHGRIRQLIECGGKGKEDWLSWLLLLFILPFTVVIWITSLNSSDVRPCGKTCMLCMVYRSSQIRLRWGLEIQGEEKFMVQFLC